MVAATVARPSSEGHVHESVVHRQRPTLLLDGPVESSADRGRDDRLQLDGAGCQVEADDAIEVIGARQGRDIDSTRDRVDHRCAEDPLWRHIPARPARRLGGAEVDVPHDDSCQLIKRVNGVVERCRVNEPVVNERLGVDLLVEGSRHPPGVDRADRRECRITPRVTIIAVVYSPRPRHRCWC